MTEKRPTEEKEMEKEMGGEGEGEKEMSEKKERQMSPELLALYAKSWYMVKIFMGVFNHQFEKNVKESSDCTCGRFMDVDKGAMMQKTLDDLFPPLQHKDGEGEEEEEE